ncbi:hypothetical protein E4T42_05802 [Aureobasidium subglaciale]|uniref:Uncharacterized protein n=1 Tax=Aureobasidium subglaciale (strain EXF-2481) TaxID=1043005 RepID=A0A074YQY0_AURSE|nr:uncharacterized protein AUEXF2481DRAFT_495608 [Aureobasidium subglaciale EXF-2481]KAI5198875.1 hypothetical protein E4T38_07310 [Aureobasidium subglaciale]KAI5217614.1 hypothetical protein E4T40_07321 [Aureobasidium subglaciale]KAI5221211.1 hypothetical protein E4T41_07162 [Aureobasidium subglaciale]KAI5248024.1 hypothetical protein E4T42_05802 [Aureobasidium subglaciale]KAI5258943.1 hypothetical protein E4T46_07139 [Aureobasidium subglaciale]
MSCFESFLCSSRWESKQSTSRIHLHTSSHLPSPTTPPSANNKSRPNCSNTTATYKTTYYRAKKAMIPTILLRQGQRNRFQGFMCIAYACLKTLVMFYRAVAIILLFPC